MAVGSSELPPLVPVPGVRIGTTSAGIKKVGRPDLVVVELTEGTVTAGAFTQNAFCAAPVQVAKQHLAQQSPRYLVVNTGNANAGTGEQGLLDARQVCAELALQADVTEQEVLPFSTGVIGEPLPVQLITNALSSALGKLDESGWEEAATGIMTTDTRPKGASRQFEYQGQAVVVTGIAKGAGMIKPNMATMLGYVATNLMVHPELLQQLWSQVVEMSFNRITVDGDTSTNDAAVLMATGQCPLPPLVSTEGQLFEQFYQALLEVSIELAQGLVRDGEGASKFVTVAVEGGGDSEECLKVAYTVAESPLVKTALFASDPNWGRILAAIGRAGVSELNVDNISVYLGDVLIAEKGARAASYTEEAGQQVMGQEEITIRIDLSRGEASETVWTSDLSHDYVRINAEYRT